MVANDIGRLRVHAAWVRFVKSTGKRPDGPPPEPAYKDCRNCPLRDMYRTQADRTQFCTEECPYVKLPVGPSRRYLAAAMWARLPEAFLVQHAEELGWQFVMDVQEVREAREADRSAMMMGASFLG